MLRLPLVVEDLEAIGPRPRGVDEIELAGHRAFAVPIFFLLGRHDHQA